MTRRRTTFISALVAVMALAGCGSGPDSETGAGPGPDPGPVSAGGPQFEPAEGEVGHNAGPQGPTEPGTRETPRPENGVPLRIGPSPDGPAFAPPRPNTSLDDRTQETNDKNEPVDITGEPIDPDRGDDRPDGSGPATTTPPTVKPSVPDSTGGSGSDPGTGPGGDDRSHPFTPPPPDFDTVRGNPPSPVIIPADRLWMHLMRDRGDTVDLGMNGWVNDITPDGGTVFFSQAGEGNAVNLYRVDVATGETAALTQGDATWGSADRHDNRLSLVGDPGGSPPAAQAHASAGAPAAPAETKPDFEIFTMNDDGTGLLQLTDNQAHDTLPDWSPDGTRIAYASDEDGDFEVYVMNADGTGRVRLTDNTTEDGFPSWSPDGTEIAYASRADGDFDIYAVPAGGGAARAVTANPIDDIFPEWTTDGIAFSREQDGDFELYFAPEEVAEGTDPGQPKERLTRNRVDDAFPAASVDGEVIAFTRLEETPPADPPSGASATKSVGPSGDGGVRDVELRALPVLVGTGPGRPQPLLDQLGGVAPDLPLRPQHQALGVDPGLAKGSDDEAAPVLGGAHRPFLLGGGGSF